ncbi:MAG: serine/threonine protein phosphatase [Bacteroidales bacterium]|nr:serine/threonine protein phosphatase [Bacteroidales bacterium]MBN2698891.1 serine/threonine protein phosphatase [Bacteroidales bacterium]
MNDFVQLPGRPEGKRYVISDIHGCYKTFRRLVEKVIGLTKSDWLFLLGDYVDRGPSSKAVLDYILELMEEGYTLFPLRGNHEDDLLKYAKGEPRFMLWHLNKHKYPDIFEEGKIIDRYYNFMNSLPYYYELDDYYIVHAGFNFKSDKPFEDKETMLWTRYFNPPTNLLKGKRVIHGHDPVYMPVILEHIEKGYPSIPLDNGAVYAGRHKIYDTSQLGKLCAFDMDHERIYSQVNIDLN